MVHFLWFLTTILAPWWHRRRLQRCCQFLLSFLTFLNSSVNLKVILGTFFHTGLWLVIKRLLWRHPYILIPIESLSFYTFIFSLVLFTLIFWIEGNFSWGLNFINHLKSFFHHLWKVALNDFIFFSFFIEFILGLSLPYIFNLLLFFSNIIGSAYMYDWLVVLSFILVHLSYDLTLLRLDVFQCLIGLLEVELFSRVLLPRLLTPCPNFVKVHVTTSSCWYIIPVWIKSIYSAVSLWI